MNYDEFVDSFYVVLERSIALSVKARHEGLLALEDIIDKEKANNRDIFEYGMRISIDGIDCEIIEEILSNIVCQEKDEYTRLLKTIQKKAVLMIQSGCNPYILAHVLNSFTDIPVTDLQFKKLP
jgi:flagellar motor component MotA